MALTAMLLRQSCRGWVSCVIKTNSKTQNMWTLCWSTSIIRWSRHSWQNNAHLGHMSRRRAISTVPTWWCTALLHHGEFDDPTRRKTYSTSWTRLWPSLGVGSIRPNDRVRHRSEAIARTTTGTIVRQRPLQWTCTIGRQRLLPCRPSPKATANGLAKDSYCCLLSHSRSTDHCRLVVPRKIYVLRKFRLTYRYARSLLARRPNSSVPEWCSRALMIQSWWWWNKDLSFLISFKVLSRDIGLILLAWRQKWHLPAVNKVGFRNISLPNNTQPMRTWTEIKITWTMTMGSRTLDSII